MKNSIIIIKSLLLSCIMCLAAPPAVTVSTQSVVVSTPGELTFPGDRQLLQTFTAAQRATTAPQSADQLGYQIDDQTFWSATGVGAGNWAAIEFGSNAWADLTGTPTTLAGYGITDAQPKTSNLDIWTTINASANVQTFNSQANYGAMRTALGVAIGSNVQAYDADLTIYGSIPPSGDVQTLLGASNYSAFRTSLGLGTMATQAASSVTITGGTGKFSTATANQFIGLPGADFGPQAGGAAGFIQVNGGDSTGDGLGGAGGGFYSNGSTPGSGNGGSGGVADLSGGPNGSGGNLNLSGNLNGGGGSINMSNGGGSLDTTGSGSLGLGIAGTRTTLTGTATADRAISLPDASGTLLLEDGSGASLSDIPLSALAQSSATTGQVPKWSGTAWVAGDVTAGIGGTVGSTDNRLVRSDGTLGSNLQATGIGVDDSDNVTVPGSTLTLGSGSSYKTILENASDPGNGAVNATFLYPSTNGGRVYIGKSGTSASLSLAYVGGIESFPGSITRVGHFEILLFGASNMTLTPGNDMIIAPVTGSTEFRNSTTTQRLLVDKSYTSGTNRETLSLGYRSSPGLYLVQGLAGSAGGTVYDTGLARGGSINNGTITDGTWQIRTTARSGVALALATRAVTSATTIDVSDNLILCDASSAAFTVTLTAAASTGNKELTIKKTDSSGNAITIDGNASETIDGATTYSLPTQYKAVTIVCDGSNWHIKSAY
jgi:hypothetical protein